MWVIINWLPSQYILGICSSHFQAFSISCKIAAQHQFFHNLGVNPRKAWRWFVQTGLRGCGRQSVRKFYGARSNFISVMKRPFRNSQSMNGGQYRIAEWISNYFRRLNIREWGKSNSVTVTWIWRRQIEFGNQLHSPFLSHERNSTLNKLKTPWFLSESDRKSLDLGHLSASAWKTRFEIPKT